MRVVVHHLNESRSERIPWLLEELGVPYEVVVHYRTPGGFASPSLSKVNPLGKAPCIELDGRLITESGAIVAALNAAFPNPAAVEAPPSAHSQFWSHFAEGSFMNLLASGAVVERGAAGIKPGLSPDERSGVDKFVKWHKGYVRTGTAKNLAAIEKFLSAQGSGSANFSGNDKLGEGDFMLGWSLGLLAPENGRRPVTLGPATEAWIARMRARPAYVRAAKRVQEEQKAQAGKAKL